MTPPTAATQPPPAPATLQDLADELNRDKKAADANAQAAADLKVTMTALTAAIGDIGKNLTQFKTDWKALQAQADKDKKEFTHQKAAAVAALGGQANADAVQAEYEAFTKQRIDAQQKIVDDLAAEVGGEGTLETDLDAKHEHMTEAQAAYDALKVSSIKASLQQLEKLLDDANKLSLPGDADAGAYYLLHALAEPLTGAPTTVPDPAQYEKSLVAAYDSLAAAIKDERAAQTALDQANKDLTAAQKELAARQASLKQDVLDHLQGFKPPPKPAAQKAH